jgi:hypothetical protein
MAKFAAGNKGRPKGATNLLNRTVKETVLKVFHDLQTDPRANLLEWGKKNPGMFYQIAAKLIPTEISANVEIPQLQITRKVIGSK